MDDKELWQMFSGSQCTNCGGFPTHLRVFDNARDLFNTCHCGNHVPRDADQFSKMTAWHNKIEAATKED